MSSSQNKIASEQRDFWESLQMDIIASNRTLEKEDCLALIERSFMFSIFFKGYSAFEIEGYQRSLGLKNNGYIILLQLLETSKSDISNLKVDEINIHHFIKKILHHKNCALSALLTNRIIILISEDMLLSEEKQKEESLAICKDLAEAIDKLYHIKITAGIGSMHSIYSIYSSFTDALPCLSNNGSEPYLFYSDLKRMDMNSNFDYLITEKHLIESVRLRKADALDYFGLMMNSLRPFNDSIKRSKILELLVIVYHSISLDIQDNLKSLDYTGVLVEMMNYSGDQLIDFSYKIFLYLTNYVKPLNTIDYSNHIVKATQEYLELHYADDISLEDMAVHVNISPQYLSKLIKKTTGFNFIDWLSMLRVKKAKELLTNSNLTVKEVCFMVGYKDPNYFSRIFKKRIGITPSEYVKNQFVNQQ